MANPTETVNVKETIKALQYIKNNLRRTVSSAMDKLAKGGAKIAKGTTIYKDRSGTLRKETKFIPQSDFQKQVVADTPYAWYIEAGNRPGGSGEWIYPKTKKFLRFEIDGNVIFARRVRSHGPLPFMMPAREWMANSDIVHKAVANLWTKGVSVGIERSLPPDIRLSIGFAKIKAGFKRRAGK
jgi:hypothetical protein